MAKLQDVGVFILKAVAFAAIFWFMWLFVLRPFSIGQQSASGYQDPQQRAQTAAYEQQLKEAARQLAIVESQQQRMEKIIATQEEHLRRYDAVLQRWERQTGLRK